MIYKIISTITKDSVYIVLIWIILLLELFYALFFIGSYQHVFTSVLGMAIISTPTILKNKYDIKIPKLLSAFIVLFTFSSLFLGENHNFYGRFWWWDIFLHSTSAVIFGFIGLAILQMIFKAQNINTSYSIVSLFAFSFAFSIGALWEVVEFLIDISLGSHMQLDSLRDTMTDLIADMLGALVTVLLAYFHWKYSQKNFVGRYIDKVIKKYSE